MARPELLHVDGLDVEVTVRRVRRMNIRVHPPAGEVRMSVPPRTSRAAIVRFVRESRGWVEGHRLRIREMEAVDPSASAPSERRGVAGEVWWHLGHAHRLRVEAADARPAVRRLPGRLVVSAPRRWGGPEVLALLDRWQRAELRRVAEPMLAFWGARMGVRNDFLGIRRMSTRWGSCVPGRRRIWLALALVERHPAGIEYVVVHELAHLREPSHGTRFRALLSEHLPGWEDRRAALDAAGPGHGAAHGIVTVVG